MKSPLKMFVRFTATLALVATLLATLPLRALAAGAQTLPQTQTQLSGPSQAQANQSLTYTATIIGNDITVPVGTVTFSVDGTEAACGPQTVSDSSAACTLPTGLAAGTHTITADYHDSSGQFADSTGGPLTVAVSGGQTQNPTATSLTVNGGGCPGTATEGQSITFTATVSSDGSPVTSGTVAFYDGDTLFGSPVGVGSDGTATLPLPTGLAPGSHQLTAAFTHAPGSDFGDSSSSLCAITVTQEQPTITQLSGPIQVALNQPATYTAVVSAPAGSATPTGSVSFLVVINDSTDQLACEDSPGPVPLVNGTASCTLVFQQAATSTLVARYLGSSTDAASTSNELSVSVQTPPDQISAIGQNLTGTAQAPLSGVVATFTDSNPEATVTASINWGDGVTTAGTVQGASVLGSHTYTEPCTCIITTTLTDGTGATGSAIGSATIAAAPEHITVTGQDISGTAGVPINGAVVATFTDSDVDADETATIDWGDGTSGAGIIQGSNVVGSHTYAQAGTYTTRVTLTDSDGTTGSSTTGTATISAPRQAATVTGHDIVGVAGEQIKDAVVATFTDPSPGVVETATIDWGDGSTSTGIVQGTTVIGSHTYETPGTYTTRVALTISDGITAIIRQALAAIGAPEKTTLTCAPMHWVEGNPGPHVLAIFTDTDNDDDQIARVIWGDVDGRTNTPNSSWNVPIVKAGLVYEVIGTHRYWEEGKYILSVRVFDKDAADAVAVCRIKVVDAPLQALPLPLQPQIHASERATTGLVPVARFVDTDPACTAGDYKADINWVTAGVSGAVHSKGAIHHVRGCLFEVYGSHTYKEDSDHALLDVTITVIDHNAKTTIVNPTVVADPLLIATPARVTALPNTRINNVILGTFTDTAPPPDDPPGGFTAVPGPGSRCAPLPAGAITSLGDGTYQVRGNCLPTALPGPGIITVQISGDGQDSVTLNGQLTLIIPPCFVTKTTVRGPDPLTQLGIDLLLGKSGHPYATGHISFRSHGDGFTVAAVPYEQANHGGGTISSVVCTNVGTPSARATIRGRIGQVQGNRFHSGDTFTLTLRFDHGQIVADIEVRHAGNVIFQGARWA
jgi:hypothetical protein